MANGGAVCPPGRARVFAFVSLLALQAAGAPVGPESEAAGSAPHRAHQRPVRHGKSKVIGVLNVNRASEAELRLLPGIGKARAALIVERRSKHPFASLDELARIRGMRKLVQKLRAHLAVSGDSTLRPAPPAAHPAPSAVHPAVHPGSS
jgi:competence protein ComEA